MPGFASPLPGLRDASIGTSQGVMDASGFAARPPHCPHPGAGIKASSCWHGAGGVYLYWEDWASILKSSTSERPLWGGRCSLLLPGLISLFPSQGAGSFGGRTPLPLLTALTKPPGGETKTLVERGSRARATSGTSPRLTSAAGSSVRSITA